MSVLLCKQACLGQGSAAFVVSGVDCYCTNSSNVSAASLAPHFCSAPCVAHAHQACGSKGFALWYTTGVSPLEIAQSCADIINNGLLLNLTYVLTNNSGSSLFTRNCYFDCGPLMLADAVTSGDASNTIYRANVTVTCPEGQTLASGHPEYAVCTRDGWSETNFTCDVGSCPEVTLLNANLSDPSRTYSSTVTVTCDPGTMVMDGARSYTITCTETLEWSPTPVDCYGLVSSLSHSHPFLASR
ncbi:uncharacterized protein LOC112562469 [Pomacea canaliculata]|uniref:uncharacterized protein LOC112562469 n=1 Tax=Pomacea canaliculata TaxID=400727 RepID=UPI000D733E2A|nr:uncharacterized protein LOC112562469 [Pomacea canaliculata]